MVPKEERISCGNIICSTVSWLKTSDAEHKNEYWGNLCEQRNPDNVLFSWTVTWVFISLAVSRSRNHAQGVGCCEQRRQQRQRRRNAWYIDWCCWWPLTWELGQRHVVERHVAHGFLQTAEGLRVQSQSPVPAQVQRLQFLQPGEPLIRNGLQPVRLQQQRHQVRQFLQRLDGHHLQGAVTQIQFQGGSLDAVERFRVDGLESIAAQLQWTT